MRRTLVLLACAAVVAATVPAGAADPPDFDYATPLLGLTTDAADHLLVADAGQGIVSLGPTEGNLILEFPGVTDVVEVNDADLMFVTGEPPEEAGAAEGASTLYRRTIEGVEAVADLMAFEEANNPDQNDPLIGEDNIESNPFDLARLADSTLVADAAGNTLLEVQDDGTVDWLALFPAQVVSTAPVKEVIGCPDAPPDLAEICELPPEIPAQPVPTSVALGPDGNYYVGELTGFPATPGASRVWRVEPGSTNVVCPGDGCEQVLTGHSFSAIIDVSFGPDGTFYVLEIDEAGFLAAEFGAGPGGTLNACDITTEACAQLQTGMFLPTASTVGANGSIFATAGALIPGQADVIEVGKEFGDDNDSVHQLDIAVLAAAGVTRGCNPPDNDRYCPDDATTRGQMAAFLVRALGLTASQVDGFVDDDGSTFEDDIDALKAAGITRGCNPPDNDEFCPDRTMSRAEMAAFLVRALGLTASQVDGFVDDDGSIFEDDIDALKAAGITRGCNPPDNDRFCPDDTVSRAQMASFLVRGVEDLG